MLPIALTETLFSTTQFIAVFWTMDKATRIVLNKFKSRNYEFSVWGLRIHHWLVGIIVAALGLMMLSAQNLVTLLYETGLIGMPWKLSSSTITIGFRLFIDDLKDLRKQFSNIKLKIKR